MSLRRGNLLLLLASVLAQATIAALQLGLPALGPAIHLVTGFDTATIGLLFGMVGVASAATLMGWGWLSDRTSARLVSVTGLLLSSTSLALAAAAVLTGQFVAMALLLVISGVSSAAPGIGIIKGMAGSFAGHPRLGLAFGIRQAAIPVGAGIAGLTLPWIALLFGLWAAFATLAVALGLAAIVIAIAQSGRAARKPASRRHDGRPPIPWRLIRPIFIAAILYNAAQIGVTALLSLYLFTERGWSYSHAALAFAFVMLAAAAGRVLVGLASDRWVTHRIAILSGLGYLTAFLLLIVTFTGDFAFSAGVLLVAGAVGMAWASVVVTVTVAGVPTERIGQVQGVLNALVWLGAGLSPPIIAIVAQKFNWSVGWFILAVCAASGALIARSRRHWRFTAATLSVDEVVTEYVEGGPDYYQEAHDQACNRGESGYLDPRTGFFVMTSIFHTKRAHCCGFGCRHCPYRSRPPSSMA